MSGPWGSILSIDVTFDALLFDFIDMLFDSWVLGLGADRSVPSALMVVRWFLQICVVPLVPWDSNHSTSHI